jgi:sec-independent protein translocase protein TatB
MDLSWSELLVVGIVALIIIGPKDLPGMFRELGRFTSKVRAMGRDFSRAMEQAAKDTGVREVADDLRKVANPKAMGLDAVRTAADKFEKWDPLKPAAKPPVVAVGPGAAATAAPAAAPVAAAASVAAGAGPATAALAEQVAARRAASAETAAALRAAKADPAPEAVPPTRTPGRIRQRPAAEGAAEGDGE